MFADLAGFTALTEAHGDARALEIAERFTGQVRALLPSHGAEEIKTIGDEVMIRVQDPTEAVRLGLSIVEHLAVPGSPPVRVGMHAGPALERNGDWFGATVNLASRVSEVARAGEVMLTDPVRTACGPQEGFELQPRGARYFKHIPDRVAVYRAISSSGVGRDLAIDPVCRMAVDPQAAAAVRHRQGVTHYFCSSRCERAFVAQPRRYVANSPAARAARAGFRFHRAAFLVVALILAVLWATGTSDHDRWPPWILIPILLWAIALAAHYRAIRHAL